MENHTNKTYQKRMNKTALSKFGVIEKHLDKLKEKVTAKIVSETNHQYQVEVDGNFYNMSKSDVD